MLTLTESIVVETGAPTEILRFLPGNLLNFGVKAEGDLRIGTAGVTGTSGYPLSAGCSRSYNHDDFARAEPDVPIVIYAATAVNTTVDVYGFFLR